jgi:hypothetical protein
MKESVFPMENRVLRRLPVLAVSFGVFSDADEQNTTSCKRPFPPRSRPIRSVWSIPLTM